MIREENVGVKTSIRPIGENGGYSPVRWRMSRMAQSVIGLFGAAICGGQSEISFIHLIQLMRFI
jgi:hypothetical protein